MNKKTTKKPIVARASTRAKTTKARTTTKSTLKKASKTVPAKKTTSRKGIVHHAKRVYRLTPKFIHGMVAGAFVGVVLVTSLGITGGVYANPQADACIRTLEFQPGNGGHIQNNGNNFKAMVKLDNGCGNRNLELKAYYAPDSLGGGSPNASQQVLFSKTALTVKVKDNDHWTDIVTKALDSGCFYQVDLVDTTHTKPGEKNDMVVFKTGGNHDCTPTTPPTPPTPPPPAPTSSYSCDALGLIPAEDHTVQISEFKYSVDNAEYDHTTVAWGDGQSEDSDSPKDLKHTYAADGTYEVVTLVYFNFTDASGTAQSASSKCLAKISFTTTPNPLFLCEISTKNILNIDESDYTLEQYPADQYTKDLSQCVVTSTEPTELVNTGPGAVLIVFGLAILGGYAFHMRHRHVQRKKPVHHKPHHAK